MTAPDLARLIADHARFPDVLRALLPLDAPDLVRAREIEGRWSPLEILAHLEEEERRDFRVRARLAAEGLPFDDSMRIDPEAWVVANRYNERDPREVMEAFVRERVASVAWLASLDSAALERTVTIPRLGAFRCGDFVAAWRVHDLLHARQLSTALAILTARQLDAWQVGYAGGIPEPPPGPRGRS